jgi:hypothetical protein
MKVSQIEINWNPNLPVFASESFLKSVGDDYGWLGGFDESGNLRCILPYTIIHKSIFNMVRFRTETLSINGDLDIQDEKSFLNNVLNFFKGQKMDIIIPPSNNSIFRTYPDGVDVAPYGSYIIDLTQSEDNLWKNINRITRQNINTAKKTGVYVKEYSLENLNKIYNLIVETLRRSKLSFMSYESLKRYIHGLGENGRIIGAEYKGDLQSCVIFGFSNYCAYAIYGGNKSEMIEGSNKLLHWEAIKMFKNIGVKQYDFMGARIYPDKGSKAEGINLFKKHLGGKLKQGYIWKYKIRPIKSVAYSIVVKLLKGGDIVDKEQYKMKMILNNEICSL